MEYISLYNKFATLFEVMEIVSKTTNNQEALCAFIILYFKRIHE